MIPRTSRCWHDFSRATGISIDQIEEAFRWQMGDELIFPSHRVAVTFHAGLNPQVLCSPKRGAPWRGIGQFIYRGNLWHYEAKK